MHFQLKSVIQIFHLSVFKFVKIAFSSLKRNLLFIDIGILWWAVCVLFDTTCLCLQVLYDVKLYQKWRDKDVQWINFDLDENI